MTDCRQQPITFIHREVSNGPDEISVMPIDESVSCTGETELCFTLTSDMPGMIATVIQKRVYSNHPESAFSNRPRTFEVPRDEKVCGLLLPARAREMPYMYDAIVADGRLDPVIIIEPTGAPVTVGAIATILFAAVGGYLVHVVQSHLRNRH